MTKDRKRGERRAWLSEESSATNADIQIFQLASDEIVLEAETNPHARAPQQPQKPAPQRGKWLDDVRTTLWQGGEEDDPPPRPTRQTAPLGSATAPSPAYGRQEPGPSYRPQDPGPPPSYQQPQAIVPVAPSHDYQREDPYGDRYGYAYQDEGDGQQRMLERPSRITIKEAQGFSPSKQLVMFDQPGSTMAEQFRILALKIKESRGMRVIALVAPTAAGQGEVVACNVALALAEGERSHVLLIDANLRTPQMASFFGLRHEGGLSEQVRQHCRAMADPWVVLHLAGKLHLLSSGSVEKNPSALLSSEAINDLMAEARRLFDYIVISPPPVMESADMKILQDQVDGAILVARAGVTRGDSIKHSISQIGAGKFVGTVLTGVKKLQVTIT